MVLELTKRQFITTGLAAGADLALSRSYDKTPPIIDIHQHTHYAQRTDETLVEHQRAMGVSRTVRLPAGSKLFSKMVYDGLGRTSLTHQYEGGGSIAVQTTFDGMGRPFRVSNPTRGTTSNPASPSDFSVTSYDSLSRNPREL